MLWVKFESIYTEVDRSGNQRRQEHRFEATGSGREVCMALECLMTQVQLPGTKPLELPYDVRNHLLDR